MNHNPYELGQAAQFIQLQNYKKHLQTMNQIWTKPSNMMLSNKPDTKIISQMRYSRSVANKFNKKQTQNGIEANNFLM